MGRWIRPQRTPNGHKDPLKARRARRKFSARGHLTALIVLKWPLKTTQIATKPGCWPSLLVAKLTHGLCGKLTNQHCVLARSAISPLVLPPNLSAVRVAIAPRPAGRASSASLVVAMAAGGARNEGQGGWRAHHAAVTPRRLQPDRPAGW